jgi:hypothetical protein
MAERDAEIPEILVGKLGEDCRRDVIVSKRFFVALKPQGPQPSANVHRGSPRAGPQQFTVTI